MSLVLIVSLACYVWLLDTDAVLVSGAAAACRMPSGRAVARALPVRRYRAPRRDGADGRAPD